jgi:adenylylsulfate kinase
MSWAIWVTGTSASQVSAVARATRAELGGLGHGVRILELDETRRAILPQPHNTDAEREFLYRALSWIARLLVEARVPVIIDAVAHRRAWRHLAQAAIARFAEVEVLHGPTAHVTMPLASAHTHVLVGDAPALLPSGDERARLEQPYERALMPALVIDTARESVAEAARRTAQLAVSLSAGAERVGPPAMPPAVWITGRPGTGKTAVTAGVVDKLLLQGVPVRVVEFVDAQNRWRAGRSPSPVERDQLHRAMAYAARSLTEAGIAVIIDATAPRRAWRDAARASIPCFAEVHLVCPSEVSQSRERAVRWGLTEASRHCRPSGDTAPDIVLDYEEPMRPELVVHTDLDDLPTTVQKVLSVIHQLQRGIAAVREGA